MDSSKRLPLSGRLMGLKAGMDSASSRDVAYKEALKACPPVPMALVDHLDRVFVDPTWTPTMQSFQEQLIFQAGVNKVKRYLKDRLLSQEAAARAARTKVGR